MTTISCCCNTTRHKKLFATKEYTIVSCSYCNLGFVNPQPDKETLSSFYHSTQTYYVENYARKESSKMRDTRRKRRRISRLLGRKSDISLLDIGCSCDFLLAAAQDRKWETYKIDRSKKESEYARKTYQVHALVTDFSHSISLPPKEFDAITMFNVIKHLQNPLSALQLCDDLLAPEGILIIGTPDFGHSKAQQLGAQWPDIKPLEHFYYFSRKTRALLFIGEFYRVP
ncbi:MAG: class I SAM-dependent methyltransferase [Candidatus Ratteibacteria bacterium]|jgi:2-polyprenyl-3-methyl-5-hydroxy-6-metoxy-1,4-benzoquinol methylase